MKNNQFFDHPIIKQYIKLIKANYLLLARSIKRNPHYKNAKKELVIFLRNLPVYFRNSTVQLVSGIFIVIFLSFICISFQVGNRFDEQLYIINIPKGYGAYNVAELLESRGIISGRYGFNILVNLFRMQNRIQAGTYEFTPNDSLISIVLKIKNGNIVPPKLCRLVFPEGMSIYKMGVVMITEGVGDGLAFQKLTNRPISDRLMLKYPFLADVPIDSYEGYLFPDTYLVPSNISSDMMSELMLSKFNSVIYKYYIKNRKKMKIKMTFHQVVTMASIVEKEAEINSERPMISSVYHNRLRIRMHLGADPTIKYVLERPGKIVSYDDLKVDSPYNTYKHYGLPPGPICNPGLESVKAAMFPATSDYMYFVARADGSHIFTKTWQEHEDAKAETRTDRIRKIYHRTVD
jgi:UPF0755 protein